MPRFINPAALPPPLSRYSQAVVLGAEYKRLIVSGQFGIHPDGTLAEGLEAQMEQAFDNFVNAVVAADLAIEDIVRISAHVTVSGSVALFRAIRESKLGKAVPSAAYREVVGLASPAYLVEIEGEAVREAPLPR
jgi:2-iminobutanoate/2-iminopropanoate deaminase